MLEVSRHKNNRKVKRFFEQKRGKKEHIAVMFVLPRARQAFEKNKTSVYRVDMVAWSRS